MSAKHARASRARWAGVPKEERSKRMSKIAKQRMANITPEERLKIGRRLVRARKAKQKAQKAV